MILLLQVCQSGIIWRDIPQVNRHDSAFANILNRIALQIGEVGCGQLWELSRFAAPSFTIACRDQADMSSTLRDGMSNRKSGSVK